jgi:hypothetical protein
MSVTRTSSESGSTGGSGCEPRTEEANTAMSLGRPTVARSELARAISQYAGRVHARLGRQHHLVSPLGAWVLVSLCSSLAGESRQPELGDILGIAPGPAASYASELIGEPHPAVGAAAALWARAALVTEALKLWQRDWPPALELGDLPTQRQLDAWADDHTFGLIKRFPLDIGPSTAFVMATALATKVSWVAPFELVDARALGPSSPWADRLHRVLHTPRGSPAGHQAPDWRHEQFLALTERAGTVAVHVAASREGLSVMSVIAEPDVDPAGVIASAYDMAWREASQPGSVERLSLFELPLGQGPLCEITEAKVQTSASGGREERYSSALPAWSAQTEVDLGGESLGFAGAASDIASALGLHDYRYEAKQSAFARYSRTGFEAAAVTGLAVALASYTGQPGTRRTATLQFGHPFAAVAFVSGGRGQLERYPTWAGLPVFSAWVATPEDAVE